MTREEAVKILTACKPLAYRLEFELINIKFTPEDQMLLAEFNKLREGNWLYNYDFSREVNISQTAVGMLNVVGTCFAFGPWRAP